VISDVHYLDIQHQEFIQTLWHFLFFFLLVLDQHFVDVPTHFVRQGSRILEKINIFQLRYSELLHLVFQSCVMIVSPLVKAQWRFQVTQEFG